MYLKHSARETHVPISGCKECKRANPNIVSVHDRSQESSSIYLLEAGMGWWSTLTPALFFPGWVAFQSFHLADLELGEKKKVRKQVGQMGIDFLSSGHPTLLL
jgi:hypothetical protein